MLKKYIYTLLLSAVCLAHIYMFESSGNGTLWAHLKLYPLMLIVCTVIIGLIYLFTAFPLSLLLNKKKKQFSILDLILYIIGSFLIILFIKLKLANVQWEGFNDLAWMEYVIWIGSAIFYWIWNSIFVLRN